MHTNRIAILAALATGFLASSANATILNVIQADSSRGSTMTMQYDGVDITGFVGPLRVSVDGSSTLENMFCLDITTHAVANSPYNAIVLPPSSINNGDRAVWLYMTYNSVATNTITGAALQLALWDVVHDGGDGFNTGHLQTSASIPSSVLAQAQLYVAASQSYTPIAGSVIYQSALGRTDRQQMIGGQVPEPGTMVMLGSGLVLAGVLRRKRS